MSLKLRTVSEYLVIFDEFAKMWCIFTSISEDLWLYQSLKAPRLLVRGTEKTIFFHYYKWYCCHNTIVLFFYKIEEEDGHKQTALTIQRRREKCAKEREWRSSVTTGVAWQEAGKNWKSRLKFARKKVLIEQTDLLCYKLIIIQHKHEQMPHSRVV